MDPVSLAMVVIALWPLTGKPPRKPWRRRKHRHGRGRW